MLHITPYFPGVSGAAKFPQNCETQFKDNSGKRSDVVLREGRWYDLAHRNRSDFLRFQCPSRTPEIAAISETRESNALSFLSIVFLENGQENHQKNKDFYPCRTPKIPGKEGKNAQKKQGIPRTGKKQGIPKKQGKEGESNAALRCKGAMESR